MKNTIITILVILSSMLIAENTTIQVVNGVPSSVYNLKFENQNVINDLHYRTSSRLTEAPETSVVNVVNSENEQSYGLPLNFTESGNYFVTIAGISGNNDKPLGLQLIGNSLCEDLLLKGAYAMEKSLNFKSKPTI